MFEQLYLLASELFVKQFTQRKREDTFVLRSRVNRSTPKPVSAGMLRALSKEPLARSAINQIKDGILSLPWRVVSTDGNDNKRAIEMVENIIRQPNSHDTYDMFFGKMIEDLLVLDQGVFEKRMVRNIKKHPLYLFPIDSDTIEIVTDWDYNPKTPRYAQSDNMGGKKYYTVNQIGMMQRTHFTHDDFGFSPMQVVYKHVQYLASVQDWANEIASNAMPKWLVNLGEAASQSDLENVRDYIESYVQGQSTLGILATKTLEAKQVSPIGDEATCLGWQKMLIQIIATCFNVPPERLGSAISNDRSTSSEKDNEMLEFTIRPWSKVVEQAINTHIIDALGLSGKLRFEFVYIPTASQQTNAIERFKKLVETDIITRNEARQALSGVVQIELPPVADGDMFLSEYRATVTEKHQANKPSESDDLKKDQDDGGLKNPKGKGVNDGQGN